MWVVVNEGTRFVGTGSLRDYILSGVQRNVLLVRSRPGSLLARRPSGVARREANRGRMRESGLAEKIVLAGRVDTSAMERRTRGLMIPWSQVRFPPPAP